MICVSLENTHICARLDQGVSVILVSTVSFAATFASLSYHCKLWFERLPNISLNSKPRVSLKSFSMYQIGAVILDPPIQNFNSHDN